MKNLKGCKVLSLDEGKIFYAKGNGIYVSGGAASKILIRLPVVWWQAIAMRFDLLARLLRLGVHHFIYDDSGGYYCVYNKKCARFSQDGGIVGRPVSLVGSRPLRIDIYNGSMVYGEYRSNSERSTVSVMIFDGYKSQSLFEVSNVRHIHAVRVKDSEIYFSTGDYGDEVGIWKWDGETIHCLLQGGQQCRAVDFIFVDDGICYGTDTPLEKNYIYKLSSGGKLTSLQEVGGSVFYLSYQAGRLWLATVVEPSTVNTSRYVELWCSKDSGGQWSLVKTFKKDFLPMKLFQYGQIQFPYVYFTRNDEVWFYLQGVRGSGSTVALSVLP